MTGCIGAGGGGGQLAVGVRAGEGDWLGAATVIPSRGW